MKPRNKPLPVAGYSLAFVVAFLTLLLGAPARPQEPTSPAQSMTEAARNSRQQISNSAKNAKVFTNDDLTLPSGSPGALSASPDSSSKQAEAPPAPSSASCDNAEHERINSELLAAQDELDQTRSALNQDPKVISDNDVDMSNFKPGASGVAFGSPPLLETQPQSPERINEVVLEERVASLKKASQISCDSPKDAEIQRNIDSAETQLKYLKRQFDLDQSAYYSKPDYAGDTDGKVKLDAEQQQIQSLQDEIDRLKSELPVTPAANQTTL
jgi:hypothetical protein